MAEKMDINTNYLSSIERGKENPTFDMLVKLSDVLETEMWELFDFGHERNQKELRESLNKLLKGLDEEKLRLAVKVEYLCRRLSSGDTMGTRTAL